MRNKFYHEVVVDFLVVDFVFFATAVVNHEVVDTGVAAVVAENRIAKIDALQRDDDWLKIIPLLRSSTF